MSRAARFAVLATFVIASLAPAAGAQDLYDPAVLRTFAITFDQPDWEAQLRANYVSQVPIAADLVLDGVLYENVGVRIRGNTSYTALPAGSQKFSLKIETDHFVPDLEVMGYDDINLNNGFRDPTFSREVVYNNYVAQFIPNPRANHAIVTINGQNWGVYINVQQVDKRMLRAYFEDDDGLRINCANNPNGPGLAYAGTNPANYSAYEIQDAGGLADPLGALISVTNLLSNEPLATWPNIDAQFAIDPSIWSVVLENFLTDDDSYVNKGCDFMTYRDPIDGRMHLLQRDANETFTAVNWLPTRNFTQANKPLLSRVIDDVPELRQRYFAHYRALLPNLSWSGYFQARFTAARNLIDAAVQADPKKLYSYQSFLDNFTTTVNMPYPGLAGGNQIGVQQFVDQRATLLAGNAELVAPGPSITNVQASNAQPDPADPVYVTAAVAPAGNPVASVRLFYRATPTTPYASLAMLDDGLSGDGIAGDGVYGALLPVTAVSGQRVAYYVMASASNAFLSQAYSPFLAERGPLYVEYYRGGSTGVRITEFMYSGAGGEFIEVTNLTSAPVDVSNWSVDDDNATPGAFSFGAIGTLAPGESLVVSEATADAFRTTWSLAATVKVIGQLGVAGGNNLGRNDRIHLYDATGALQDRLYYGDQNFPGTIRTQNVSGQTQCNGVGANTIAAWQLSAVGDVFGSVVATTVADIGAPGRYVQVGCDGLFANGFED
jgi:hypothetical protein